MLILFTLYTGLEADVVIVADWGQTIMTLTQVMTGNFHASAL